MAYNDNVMKVISFFNLFEDQFEPVTQKTPYYHMGATITDAVLQAGLNYNNVVYPRVKNLLYQYSQYRTTCDFIILFQTIPLEDLIEWKNERKLNLIKGLSWFFQDNNIQNEDQLSSWLKNEFNVALLAGIKGIGPKTIDYLKMLSGNQAIAIDRHLFCFLRLAGVVVNSYEEARVIYEDAAKRLCLTDYEIDRKIWLFMSSKQLIEL